jgi:tetratricopeptide (TPR) repeat protein
MVYMLLLPLLLAMAPADFDCRSTKACNEIGTAAYKKAQYPQAIAMFEKQIDYAEVTDGEQDDRLAYNNAALAWWKSGHCLAALQYVRLAKGDNPPDTATLVNETNIKGACKGELMRDEIAGEYWQYAGAGLWNTLVLKPVAKGKYQLKLLAQAASIQPLSDNDGALNVGSLTATGTFKGKTFQGVYAPYDDASEQCTFSAKRGADFSLDVLADEREECAFGGLNIGAGGLYFAVNKGKAGLDKHLRKIGE